MRKERKNHFHCACKHSEKKKKQEGSAAKQHWQQWQKKKNPREEKNRGREKHNGVLIDHALWEEHTPCNYENNSADNSIGRKNTHEKARKSIKTYVKCQQNLRILLAAIHTSLSPPSSPNSTGASRRPLTFALGSDSSPHRRGEQTGEHTNVHEERRHAKTYTHTYTERYSSNGTWRAQGNTHTQKEKRPHEGKEIKNEGIHRRASVRATNGK